MAVTLILALLNLGYINLALASSSPSPERLTAKTASNSAPEPASAPPDQPPHATKADIKQDLDDTKSDLDALKGTDPTTLSYQFFTDSGFDDVSNDITDAKNDVDNMSEDDFDKSQGNFDKLHKKFKNRKKNMAAILGNPALMAVLHSPPPLRFRLVMASASIGTAPADGKSLAVSRPTKDINNPSAQSKSAPARGAFAKNLSVLNVMVMPEVDNKCTAGDGTPKGINDVIIARAVTFLAEAVKEAVPDDTATALPHGIAVIAWAAAKGAELLLDSAHAIYMECNTFKDGEKLNNDVNDIKSTVNGINSHTDTIKSDIITKVTDVKTEVTNNKTEINNNVNSKTDTIIEKIGEGANKTSDAVNNSTTTITNNISNSFTTLNTNVTNTKNEINTNVTNTKNELNSTINDNRTLIINNANTNTAALSSLSLRLMIEADLASPDNSTPLAIFETPAAKGGYIELARSIVLETITNLAGASAAQAKSFLAQGDAYKAAGNFKAAYAYYRKAYKAASN
jgi:hypothetical protein